MTKAHSSEHIGVQNFRSVLCHFYMLILFYLYMIYRVLNVVLQFWVVEILVILWGKLPPYLSYTSLPYKEYGKVIAKMLWIQDWYSTNPGEYMGGGINAR